MTRTTPSQVRLYAILARRSPFAVIFRRGPSKQVLLIRWDTSNDTFEYRQWFRGRIYERRCDLSPDGDLLIYFAAKYKQPRNSWTAVRRPPYFTALAMWPKGDCWGGGGHFISQHRIALTTAMTRWHWLVDSRYQSSCESSNSPGVLAGKKTIQSGRFDLNEMVGN